jgi:16S rRNA (cytidine1402-2'-O)-methyltransferase
MPRRAHTESPTERDAAPPAGCLYLVATPIGNLEDITLRALRVLKEASVVACEDTRRTQKLLQHYGIATRMVSYHEHNEHSRTPELVAALGQGAQVALVSDAGMPLVSDPGHRLVTACIERGIRVVPVPGPSAVVAALAAAGLPCDEFVFVGFLPARSGERRRALERLRNEPRTMVFYEAPHRLLDTLTAAAELFAERQAVVARELTKVHEEFVRGSLRELAAQFSARPPRGETTLLVAASTAAPASAEIAADAGTSLAARVEQLIRDQGLDRKAALKRAAKEFGIPKREAYKRLLAGGVDEA